MPKFDDYPKTVLAVLALANDNDCGALTIKHGATVPRAWARRVATVEAQLASFTDDEVETLAVGDYDEAAPLRRRAPLADRFLNWAFEHMHAIDFEYNDPEE